MPIHHQPDPRDYPLEYPLLSASDPWALLSPADPFESSVVSHLWAPAHPDALDVPRRRGRPSGLPTFRTPSTPKPVRTPEAPRPMSDLPDHQHLGYRDPQSTDYALLQHIVRQGEAVLLIHIEDTPTKTWKQLQQDDMVLRDTPDSLRDIVRQGHAVVIAGGYGTTSGTYLRQVYASRSSICVREIATKDVLRKPFPVYVMHAAFPKDRIVLIWFKDFRVESSRGRDKDDNLQRSLDQNPNKALSEADSYRGPRIFRSSITRVYNLPQGIKDCVKRGALVYVHGYPRSKRKEVNPGYRRLEKMVRHVEGLPRGYTEREGQMEPIYAPSTHHSYDLREIREPYRPELLPKLMWGA